MRHVLYPTGGYTPRGSHKIRQCLFPYCKTVLPLLWSWKVAILRLQSFSHLLISTFIEYDEILWSQENRGIVIQVGLSLLSQEIGWTCPKFHPRWGEGDLGPVWPFLL